MSRLSDGGMIDREITLNFTFDGQPMVGHPGDTIASALLANGQHLVARSIKYHRPRGIMSAGLEEPSALVTVRDETGSTPNLKVTEVSLRDGLEVSSQNNWPSLTYDRGATLALGGKSLSAGFYYKTFKWPRKAWQTTYAPIIRKAAGHGEVDATPDTALYDKRRKACDVLVIGSGATGLSAAITAAQSGATTIVLEQDSILGGTLLSSDATIAEQTATHWAEDAADALVSLSNVTVMTSTLAFGQYDHGLVQAVEQQTAGSAARSILWKIRAQKIILAAGAIERPIVFPGNDRPGIMLAGALQTYVRRFAVVPGKRAVVAVAEPNARADTIRTLEHAGVEIAASLNAGDQILSTQGRLRVSGLTWRNTQGHRQKVACDLVAMSAGWMPTAHLFAQMGQPLEFDANTQSLLPPQTDGPLRPVGGARGVLNLRDCIADGKVAAHQVLAELQMHKHLSLTPPAPTATPPQGFGSGKGKAFVDFQNDVTRDDIALAQREGYTDIELTKRYTTLGMGTDQGKTSWTNGILEIAALTGEDPAKIGHTTYRPAYSPVSLGALIGTEVGEQMLPTRRTPFHAGFEKLGCVYQTSGDWLYSRYFPKAGETMEQAITRECHAVRRGLGCVDMSTLGKIDVKGPDALEFLSRLYCNNFAKIKVGRMRYALMLREDGYVFDDGTIARLSDTHFVVTATTANAGSVWRHMRKSAQLDWPELDVVLTSVSDHWASLAIAGPHARDLLIALNPDFDVSPAAFPFASVREGHLGGLPVRVFSVSFSGELSYEINVPAGFADTLLSRVIAGGEQWDITPYGLETLDVLRIEKGHLSIGTEVDGRRTPADLGLGGMVSHTKGFVGRALLQRKALQKDNRAQLVGLESKDGATPIPIAAHLCTAPLGNGGPMQTCGYLTAAIHSPTLDHPIALAFLEDGQNRMGEVLWAHSPIAGKSVQVRVTAPCAYDPKGERLNA
ncbi:2Fe-2S iron-sulfur cluster-binding protein [Falsiruegeria litorea]|uniref:2Fe-2S iron-sulfur cluster-binding protein n=1 Tax=Falsiruegeria litorea TaxID=1280831 RepID=UPI001BFD5A80|nr:2Fe-2S iron-sulfur cluster-binding protein [Falsiruegeria litorea]MBT8169475.1 (2Fe-2S)-binding protein [Falsiruegeria litorea]